MTMEILRRNSGAAGPPSALKSGQLAVNEVDAGGPILYYGLGNDGNKNATSIVKVGGIGAFLALALLNAANGVAGLDGTGKIPTALLPAAVLGGVNYQGTWNPNTNSPQLLSGQGTKGFLYKITVAANPTLLNTSAAQSGTGTGLSFSSTSGVTVGQLVTGTGIAAGTTVAALTSSTVTLSQATTAAVAANAAITFAPYLDGTTQFNVGDQVVYDGSAWDKIDGISNEVVTVAGLAGAITATALKAALGIGVADVAGAAPRASPGFSGAPTAPTPAAGDNTIKLATTAFIANALQAFAPLASPALTGTPTAPTASAGDNTTKIATTAFITAALGAFATLASPALTGSPTAPTQSSGDNSTKLATTAFIQSALAAFATLASPTLTGSPKAPTPAAGDSSTLLATTAFVTAAVQAAANTDDGTF